MSCWMQMLEILWRRLKELDTMKAEGFSEGSVTDFESISEINTGSSSFTSEDDEMDSDIDELNSSLRSGSSSPVRQYWGTYCSTNVEGGILQGDSHSYSLPDSFRINPLDIKIDRSVARGASAKVYEATWSGCGCAVKRFASAYNKDYHSELQQELDILTELRHPHIVRLMGMAIDSQQRCLIVMELMSSSLRALIDFRMQKKTTVHKILNINSSQVVPFALPEAVDIITKIALAMAFFHSKGYTHRDLKSLNVLVRVCGNYNEVKVSDFGLSRDHEDSSEMQPTIGVGTSVWCAPEILQAADTSKKTDLKAADVYSFAITCFEVLTGKVPLKGQILPSKYDTVILLLKRELPDNLDDDLRILIESCWDLDPNKRPSFEVICGKLVQIRSKMHADPWESVIPEFLLKLWHRLIHQGNEQAINSLEQESTNTDVMEGEVQGSDSVVSTSETYQRDESDNFKKIQRSHSEISISETYQKVESDKLMKDPKPLAKGGSAKVYVARWLGCKCAVKVFKTTLTSSRLPQREVNLLTKLHHPHIVQLLGISVDSKRTFSMVMEFMSADLRQLIESRIRIRSRFTIKAMMSWPLKRIVVPFDLPEAVGIITKIALGVAFMHSRGVMHRDLKPGNVLAEEHIGNIDVKIVDFGSAYQEHAADSGKTYAFHDGEGTAFYRAPEILPIKNQKKTVDKMSRKPDLKAADVYSFAMVCYEVLTGEIPLSDVRRTDYDRVIAGHRPTLPSDVHPKLKSLIEQCWHGDPVERPNFTKICEQLQSIQKSLPFPSNLVVHENNAKKPAIRKIRSSRKDVMSMSDLFKQVPQVQDVFTGLLGLTFQGYEQSINSPTHKSRSSGVLEVYGLQRSDSGFSIPPWYLRTEPNKLIGVRRHGKGTRAEVCKAPWSGRTFTVKMFKATDQLTHPSAAVGSRFSYPSSSSPRIAPVSGLIC